MIEPRDDVRPVGVMPDTFEADYVEGAVKPFFLSSVFLGEHPTLPMIDLALTKEEALAGPLWGMLYEGWAPNGEEDGLTVFLQGYEHRGPDNERKRIYASAVTPDLYDANYRPKVTRFFDQLFADGNASQPFMHEYFAQYFDLYWDLHLGASGDAVPSLAREIGASFNTVLAYRFPTLEIFHENYMRVRELREPLKEWIDVRVQAIIDGEVAEPEKTFVHYWLKNGGEGENFRRKDIVFECFHNFVALSQWGNSLFNIMTRLDTVHGDPAIRSWFERTMSNEPDGLDGGTFTPLDRFVMELFRVISPNDGSVSKMAPIRQWLGGAYTSIVTPHPPTNHDARHWSNPAEFDPTRFVTVLTSLDNDEARCQEAGLARCPFSQASLPVTDGRQAELTNSGYGAVYAVVDNTPYPVCDMAGYAPFGFGYRRCPGELFTVDVVKDFLRTVWNGGIEFVSLDLENPERLPVGPGTVISDTITFRRSG